MKKIKKIDGVEVNDADSFKSLVEQKIQEMFDDRQKRIDEALGVGIEPTEIQKYERNIKILDDISEAKIKDHSEEGAMLRKNIIYEDYIQRGFTPERAEKAVNRSVLAGTDVEDALESLQSCKETVQKNYQSALDTARKEKEEEEKAIQKQSDDFHKSILNDKTTFLGAELDKNTRQKVYDSLMKPISTDEYGNKLTAIQKYERENRTEFMKNLGYLFVLTDGFKSLDKLTRGPIKKAVSKGIRELEHTINSTSRNQDGSVKFVSGIKSDPESMFSRFTLDI